MASQASQDDIDKAYALFMLYRDKEEICAQTGIASSTYDKHARKWRTERREKLDVILQDKLDIVAKNISDYMKMSVPVMYNAVVDRAKRQKEKPMSMNEVKAIAESVSLMDRMIRLTMDKPTEIQDSHMKITEGRMDVTTLLQKLKQDDFIEIVPLRSKEKEDEFAESQFGQDSIGIEAADPERKSIE